MEKVLGISKLFATYVQLRPSTPHPSCSNVFQRFKYAIHARHHLPTEPKV